MKKTKILIIGLLAPLLLFGCFQKTLDKLASLTAKPVTGEMKYYEEDDFSVAFPEEPEYTKDLDGMKGSHYVLDHGEIAYFVSIVDIPELEGLDEAGQQLTLASGMNGSVGDLELDNYEEIVSNGYPGLHFYAKGESDGSYVVQYAKIFLVGTKLVQALGIGVDASSEEGPEKFVESFQLGNFE